MDFDISDLMGGGGGGAKKKPGDPDFHAVRDREERFNAATLGQVDAVLEDMGKKISQVTDRVTPGFMKRWKNAKIFDLTMREGEANVIDLNKQVKKTIVKELQRHDKEEQLRIAWKEQQLEEAKIRDEVYKPITDAAKAAKERADREDYQQRRQNQLAEVQRRIDAENKILQDRVEKELFQRRTTLSSHYGEQRSVLNREARESRKDYIDGLTHDYDQGLDDLYDEFGHREYMKARLQTEAPGYSSNQEETYDRERFGIFGRAGRNTDPDGQGDELLEDDRDKENYEPFLDTHDVKVFSSEPNTFYEEKNDLKLQTESDLMRDKQLYDALQHDCKMLSESMERMCQMREMAERDAFQVQNENKLAEGQRLLIPPKRLPGEMDKETIHDRRERWNLMKRRISDLQYSINKADERKRTAESQMLTLAKQIAMGKDKNNQLGADLEAVNGKLGMLPVVVGHGLRKVKGLGIHQARPKDFLDAVRQQSKIIDLKEISKDALKQFKDRNSLDQQLWITAQEKMGRKGELEKVHNLLMDINDRIKNARSDATRINIVDALKAFQIKQSMNTIELTKVKVRQYGLLPWFRNVDQRYSTPNVEAYKSSSSMGAILFEPPLEEDDLNKTPEQLEQEAAFDCGLALAQGKGVTGYCVGVLEFPRNAAWTVYLTVLQKENKKKSDDIVTEMNGPSMTPFEKYLSKTGSAHNSANISKMPSRVQSKMNTPIASRRPSTTGTAHVDETVDHAANASHEEKEKEKDQKINFVQDDSMSAVLGGESTASSVSNAEKHFDRDFITIHFGSELGNMTHVGTYHYKPNPETGNILYDVKFIIKSKQLAYRFDFSVTNEHSQYQLAAEIGRFEEYHVPEIEWSSDPFVPEREIALTDYVQHLRLVASIGNRRETSLLEELIRCEEGKGEYWDSNVIDYGTSKRYDRATFMKLLKGELLMFIERSEKKQQEKLNGLSASVQQSGMGASESQVENSEEIEEPTDKLQRSMRRFIDRKRQFELPRVDFGMSVIGKQVMIYNMQYNIWENNKCLDCTIAWVENGCKAKVTHTFQMIDNRENDIGTPYDVELDNVRYMVLAVPPARESDASYRARMARFKLNRQITELDREIKTQTLRLQKRFYDFKVDEERALEEERKVYRSNLRANNEFSARQFMMTDKRAKRLVNSLARKMKAVVRDADGEINELRSYALAIATVEELFIENRIEQVKEELKAEFKILEDDVADRIEKREIELDHLLDRIVKDIEKDKQVIREKINRYRNTEGRVMSNRVKFTPDAFAKALPPKAYNCEHLRTRYWGNEYGNGQKCLICGKEIAMIFQEDHQLKGWGSGTDPWMNDAVARHRENEESFKFKSSEELVKVEHERRRLEKERREINENEGYFYDFDGIRAMYDFDRRHRSEIKSAGIFRQGLQWTTAELEQLELDNIEREKQRLKKAGLQIERNMTDFEPLHTIEDPPSTFRAQEERHRAQYHDTLFVIGRLQNFQKRIAILKDERIVLQDQRSLYGPVLEYQHFEMLRSDDKLKDLEIDLDRAGSYQQVIKDMKLQWELGKNVLETAERDYRNAQIVCAGLAEDVLEARDLATFLHEETNTMLKTKHLLDTKTESLETRMAIKKEILVDLKNKFMMAYNKAQNTFYLQPGEPVITRYGYGYIVAHREEDDMLLVTLPFCQPPARVYILTREIFDVERGRQQGEGKMMEMEDRVSHKARHIELLRVKRENFLMSLEEDVRAIWQFRDFNISEDKDVHEAFDKAIKDSYKVISSNRFARIQQEKVEGGFKKYLVDLEKVIKSYEGPPSGKPKMPSKWEQFQKKKKIIVELKEIFMKKAAGVAEVAIRKKLTQERTEWMANFMFENMMREIVNDMIKDVTHEAIVEGEHAKHVAEQVSGIMFPDPTWMQFGIYSSLANTWRQRKEYLRRQIALKFGSSGGEQKKLTQNKVIDEMQTKRETALRRSKRAERRRQVQMCSEMEDEEELSRRFYKWELLENLRERRLMRSEDVESKMMREAERYIKEVEQSAYFTSTKGRTKGGNKGGGGDGGQKDSTGLASSSNKDENTSPNKTSVKGKGRRGNGNGGGGGGGGNRDSGGGGGGGGDDDGGMTEEQYQQVLANMGYERRRDYLKEVALSRRKREEDRARMIVEDDHSKNMRAQWIIEDAQARMKKEFGDDDEDDDDGVQAPVANVEVPKPVSAANSVVNSASVSSADPPPPIPELDLESLRKRAEEGIEIEGDIGSENAEEEVYVDLPFWMDTPRGWEEWNFTEQKTYVKYHTGVRKRQKRIDRSIAREYLRLEKLQQASYKEWKESNRRTEFYSNEAELKCMIAEEEMKEAESAMVHLVANQTKIRIYARNKGDQELRAKSSLRKKEEVMARRERELDHARQWMKSCQSRQRLRDRLMQKVIDNCTWIDTQAITGFMQRYRTDILFERLYVNYFRQLSRSIAIRAETVATERILMRNQEQLTINKAGIVDRVIFLKKHAKDQQREELLRMRRSVLNERLFPMNRRDILTNRFGGWLRYFFYKRGMREAFTCKYEVIRQQMQIDRQFKEQLQKESDIVKKPILPPRKTNDTNNYTVMQRHREKTNLCKTCRNYYLESQNTSYMCNYHPNPYGLYCPKNCPNPGLTPLCVSHRMRRWRCCDNTKERATGCSRRYHIPPDADPIYDKVMAKVEERDKDELADLDERLEIARLEKYPQMLQELQRKQVDHTEHVVARERDVADRYHQLKWL